MDGLYEYVERALRGQIAYLRDRDYVVVDGEVIIVDEFTGRMMPGRQWQDGLHQAIQGKEKLEITLETITAARVTVQDFFKRFSCEQRARLYYCEGYWGQVAQCPSAPTRDHGQ